MNTAYSCLALLDKDSPGGFRSQWHPPFITASAPEDRCHLNGMAMVNGRPQYATSLGESNVERGWRSHVETEGTLIHVPSRQVVLRNLPLPHSPRVYDSKLYVLLSGLGEVVVVDPNRGCYESFIQLPGFGRGMVRHGDYLFIGLSGRRQGSMFRDLPVFAPDRHVLPGIAVVDLRTASVVGHFTYSDKHREILDLQVLPGVRHADLVETSPGQLARAAAAASRDNSHGKTPRALAPSSTSPRVVPAANGGEPGALVYALGTLSYDFGTEARRDAILQSMAGEAPNPDEPTQLVRHFETNPQQAQEIIWTLNLDQTPIYAIHPWGAFANQTYQTFCDFLKEQLEEGVERISVPGVMTGQMVRLRSGQVIPVVIPDPRSMYSWSTDALIEALGGEPGRAGASEAAETSGDGNGGMRNFLDRVYFELRNRGVTPQERAINYSATNAFQVHQVFEHAIQERLALNRIDVERSAICREGASCWDVKLTFFDPTQRLQRAKKVYRFTVDVSDVIPVTVGEMRAWSVFAKP